MKIGDIVRLSKPFRPIADSTQEYSFGVIAGLVFEDSLADSQVNLGISNLADEPSCLKEIVLYLHDPENKTSYIDEQGVRVLYVFYPDEVTWIE
jgi:hypothetical protein